MPFSAVHPEPEPPGLEPVQGPPLDTNRLEYLVANNLLSDELFLCEIVATSVDRGQLSYVFAVSDALTGEQMVELPAQKGGRTEALLLKQLILELINDMDRYGELVPTHADLALAERHGRRIYDDGQFAVIDIRMLREHVDPFVVQSYSFFELRGAGVCIDEDYPALWKLGQQVARRYHQTQKTRDGEFPE